MKLHTLLLMMMLSITVGYTMMGEDPVLDATTNTTMKQGHLQEHKGRKHCFRNPQLTCKDKMKCCTHVSQKQLWCCPDKSKCSKYVKMCEMI